LNTGGTGPNPAFEATPILAISHNLAASRNLRRSIIHTVHHHVESREPWTRTHFLKDDRASICVFESVYEESFGASVLTEIKAACQAGRYARIQTRTSIAILAVRAEGEGVASPNSPQNIRSAPILRTPRLRKRLQKLCGAEK